MIDGSEALLAAELDPELVAVTADAPAKGFASFVIVALVRSKVNCEVVSCFAMVAAWSLESSAAPLFHAAIQLVLDPARSMVPPVHDAQLEHLTLAVIRPVLVSTPDPCNKVRVVVVSSLGCVWPVPVRGDMVTLPVPSAYMTKMLEPDICEPWPRAVHVYEVGA